MENGIWLYSSIICDPNLICDGPSSITFVASETCLGFQVFLCVGIAQLALYVHRESHRKMIS